MAQMWENRGFRLKLPTSDEKFGFFDINTLLGDLKGTWYNGLDQKLELCPFNIFQN